jgi:hypothetical protein
MLISLAGGAIGIALGIGGALLASKFGSLPVALNLEVILLATGFSVATGLFFGYYPARKASQTRPDRGAAAAGMSFCSELGLNAYCAAAPGRVAARAKSLFRNRLECIRSHDK